MINREERLNVVASTHDQRVLFRTHGDFEGDVNVELVVDDICEGSIYLTISEAEQLVQNLKKAIFNAKITKGARL